MLEEKWTYAEELVKRQRRYQKTEKINMIEPENKIEDGFLVINYKKRLLEKKELADGSLSMILPKDWIQADIEDEAFFYYCSPVEKEVLRFCVIEEEKDSEPLFQEEREMFQNGDAVFIKGETWIDGTMTIQWLQEDFYYYSFLKEVNNKICYGIFRVHKYRKKAWETIIPQLIETISDKQKEE